MNVFEMMNAAEKYMSATEVDPSVTAARVTKEETLQNSKNADYDNFLKAEMSINGNDEAKAKRKLAAYGITKVEDMDTWKANKELEIEQELQTNKENKFLKTLQFVQNMANETEANKPKDRMDQFLDILIAERTGQSYYPYQQAPRSNIDPVLAEKSRLSREMENQIANVKELQKARVYNAGEATSQIIKIRQEYSAKIKAL